MLRKVFQSQPIKYATTAPDGYLFGIHYGPPPVPPYTEGDARPTALFVHDVPTKLSNQTIYMLTQVQTAYWPSWGVVFHRWDSYVGTYVGRVGIASNLGSVMLGGAIRSRLGKLYWIYWHGTELLPFSLGDDEEQQVDTALVGRISTDHFEGLGQQGFNGSMAIDDDKDVFVQGSFRDLKIWSWSTGKYKYSIRVSDSIACVALEDDSRCYILLGNRELVLYDYVRNEIMGAAKVPSSVSGRSYWNNGDVQMTWDWVHRRLLISEREPDSPNGASNTKIRGYRPVPQVVRLTIPIPLKHGRKGRIIPVLTQVVGDMNEGVSGFLMTSQVAGDAQLVGIPLTDGLGRTITKVLCGVKGTPIGGGGTAGGSGSGTKPDAPRTGGAIGATAYAALAPQDGFRVTASLGGGVIQFGTDTPMTFAPGSSGLAATWTSTGYEALVRGSDDRVYRVTRQGVITDVDSAFGNNSVGYSIEGAEYWISDLTTYKVDGVSKAVPQDGTGDYIGGQGWTQILSNGEPAWSDNQTHELGGVLCTRCIRMSHWEIGMDGESVTNRFLALDHRNGTLWIVPNSDTQIGPGLYVHSDGTCTVAVSLPTAFVHSSEFTSISGDGSHPQGPTSELTYVAIDPAGVTPDVGYYEGATYIVYEVAGDIRVLRDGMEVHRVGLKGPGAFPRVVGKSCVFRNGSEAVYWPDLDQGPATWQIFGGATSGQHPVAMNPMVMMSQQGPTFAVNRRDRQSTTLTLVGQGNEQGLSRVTKTGFVLMSADAVRKDANGTQWGKQAAFGSSLIVCEGMTDGAVVRMNDEASTEIKLWAGQQVLRPRIAVFGGDVSVVCYGGSGGVRVAQFPTSEILGYTPGDAAGWGTGTGSSGTGTGTLAPVIGRDLWFGYFFQFSSQYGDNPNAPGNCAYIQDAEKIAPAIAAGKKLIVGGTALAESAAVADEVIGLWCAGGTEEELEAEAAKLAAIAPGTLTGKPIVGNFDGGQRMPSRAIAGVDWLALECYTGRDETAAQCQARVQACINNLGAAHEYLLIGQSYTSNSNNTTNPQVLIDTQYIPANIAKMDTKVVAILMFSDGRPTGTREHEEWRPIHAAIYQGIGAGAGGSTIGDVYVPPGMFKIKCSITLPEAPLTPTTGPGAPGTGGGGGTGTGTGGYVWAWMDLGGPPYVSRDPEANDPQAYFFGLINKSVGDLANDYQVVLKALQNNGMMINPPAGAPVPEDAPFHGITLMVDASGSPRGRIWLPTETSQVDANGNIWYTHEIQVITDAPPGMDTGPLAPGEPATGPGSRSQPIVAMSSDPAQIMEDVRSSLDAIGGAETRPDSYDYWYSKASEPEQFSNGQWHLGWNRYWETRAMPGNDGSADPELGKLPSIY